MEDADREEANEGIGLPGEVTELLGALRGGRGGAFDEIFPLLYRELRARAHGQLRRCRPGDTLNTTALVNEAYVKLAEHEKGNWRDRGHFLAVASLAMRQILVDYARQRSAKKRGGEDVRVELEEGRVGGVSSRAEEILAVDQALSALSGLSERLGQIVELRYFGGLSVEETAEVMGMSDRTVKRDWRKARAFLYRRLGGTDEE